MDSFDTAVIAALIGESGGGGDYVDVDQGTENAGKVMAVGADGKVAPTNTVYVIANADEEVY